MSEFTYQRETTGFKLENWEWDNTWIDHPNDHMKKRLFYIGDSISCGTRKQFNGVSGGKVTCDGFGTSKALDNPFFFESLRLFAAQLNGFECVLFNSGLHGWHLNPDEYENYYEKMVKFLISEFKGVPVYIVLTTSTKGDEESERSGVKERNERASRVAEKYGLKTIDLYSVSLENRALRCDDGVHYTDEGYKKFAEYIYGEVSK